MEQRITYEQVVSTGQIQVTCYLTHDDHTDAAVFRMDKNYLYQDWMWQEIRRNFSMLDRNYAVRKGWLNFEPND